MVKDSDFGWQLPTVVNPAEYWCYRINIPQDIAFLRALRGAIGELAYSYNWQPDVAETGKLVATKWLGQIAEAEQFLAEGDCGSMDCAQIIACINDPESGVSTAIINILNDSDSLLDVGQSQGGLLLGDGNNISCDKDAWYGGIDNLVRALDENNLDSLQILEVMTNVNEWIAEVLGGVLGVEVPIVQSVIDWANFIQNNIMENYEAQITQQYKETLVCDLLCIAMENCELTPQHLVDYFFGRLSSQLTFNSLLNESLEFLVLGVWTGTEIADFMMLSQLVFRAQFGRWFADIAFNSIDTDIRLGLNDPSNDWTLICDDCIVIEEICKDMTTPIGMTLVWGAQDNVFGNALPSIKGVYKTPSATFWTWAEYFFDDPVTVVGATLDHYNTITGGGLPQNGWTQKSIQFFDEFDSFLGSVSLTDESGYLSWSTIDTGTISIADVKRVMIFHGISSAGISGSCWVDNLCISYEALS